MSDEATSPIEFALWPVESSLVDLSNSFPALIMPHVSHVCLADGDEKTVTVLVDNEESTLAFSIQNSIVLPVSKCRPDMPGM
jgi:hypothetical protein